jgi:hypothetical protein
MEETMSRIREHLSYANVVATLCLFLLIGGGTAFASFVVSSNSQVAQNTISGHHPPSGKHPNIIGGSVNATDLSGSAVTNPKLGANAVTGAKVQNGSLTAADAASNTFTGGQINESTLSGVDAATVGGRSANQLIQGTGNVFSNSSDVAASTSNQTVLNVPGIGNVTADCNGSATAGAIGYINTSTDPEDYVRDNLTDLSRGALFTGNAISRATGTTDLQVYFIQSAGKLATIRIAFITPSDSANVPSGTCRVYAQAVVTS